MATEKSTTEASSDEAKPRASRATAATPPPPRFTVEEVPYPAAAAFKRLGKVWCDGVEYWTGTLDTAGLKGPAVMDPKSGKCMLLASAWDRLAECLSLATASKP